MNKVTITIKNIETSTAHNGSLTAKVRMSDNQSFFLHSRYSPEQEAKDWLKQFDLQPNTAYLVMGFGLGYHVKELLNNLPKNSYIYILEHNKGQNTVEIAHHYFPKKECKWMTDERISCFLGEQVRVVAGYIIGDTFKKKIRKFTVCKNFPAIQMFTEFYLQFEKELLSKIEELFWIKYQFPLISGLNCMENIFKNIPYMWSNPGINKLSEKFKNIPAIIVSSGPSLNKNIEELKKYTDKAIVICSGSAVGALHKHNIIPHFLTVLDPYEASYADVEKHMNKVTALLTYCDVHHKVVSHYIGQRFFCNDPAINLGKLGDFLPSTASFNKNVSVAALAFELAVYIGANPIVFIGQDLSFIPTCARADGANGHQPLDLPDENYVYVKGQQGEILKSIMCFKELLDYFIMRFAEIKQRTIINATEGGVYMDGALHMTLNEVGERYILGQEQHDFSSNIQEIVDKFEPQYYTEICNYLTQLLTCIENLQTSAEQCFINAEEMGENEYIKQMDKYFEDVKRSLIYLHIKYFQTLFQLLFHEQCDSVEFHDEFSIKLDIKNKIVEMVNLLEQYIAESLQVIHTIHNGQDEKEDKKNAKIS